MTTNPIEPSRKNKRNIGIALFIVGIFLVGTAVLYYLTGAQQQILQSADILLPPAVVSYPAPSLSLTALDGVRQSLSDYKGKVVLVNNWATWCPPCKEEMPILQSYFESHTKDNFVIVAIESGEPAADVSEFVRTYELSFPVWLDPKGLAVEAFNNWNLPSTYIIDRTGTVRLSWTGQLNQATLDKFVTPLLEK